MQIYQDGKFTHYNKNKVICDPIYYIANIETNLLIMIAVN